ncbi:MAG: hypothetical protein AAF575_08630 [Bacteroidota bacterium]
MYLLVIVWAFICAFLIIAYPIYLYKKSSPSSFLNENELENSINQVELYSFDLKNKPMGWSLTLKIPEITEEVLFENTILFYLETDETCLKLPINNATLGYTANVFKNIGKVYLTFKCLKDGVTNYSTPPCHLHSLKVLLLKSQCSLSINSKIYNSPGNHRAYQLLKLANINIHDYEETLGYLSNISKIHFKGHYKNRVMIPQCKKSNFSSNQELMPELYGRGV